jgi:Erv1 / Alr family
MDTRFWGPSGWRLLHSITFAYIPHSDKISVREMFTMLPFVLPCKYCRTSLTEYMERHPLEPALESRHALTRWLWKIHNEVNSKLRNQKLPVKPDPPFEDVEKFYRNILTTGCSRTEFPGWDFLFSIADLHPYSMSARKSIAMPGAPPCETMATATEKNKWNCLSPEERLPFYNTFWRSIGLTLPFKEWKESWIEGSTNGSFDTRNSTIKWLWAIRCKMENDLELLNSCNYSSLCKTLISHRSDCSKKLRGKTCRKRRKD